MRRATAFALAPGRVLEMSGPDEPDGVLLGARLAVPLSRSAAFFFGYDGRLGGDFQSHAGTAGLPVAF